MKTARMLVNHTSGIPEFSTPISTIMLLQPDSRIVIRGYINQYADWGSFIVPVLDAIAAREEPHRHGCP